MAMARHVAEERMWSARREVARNHPAEPEQFGPV